MKKFYIKCGIFLLISGLAVLFGYFGLRLYYKNNIPYGTWINGIYCTGLKYDEAAEQLLAESDQVVEIDILDGNGQTHHIILDEKLYTLSYREGLEDLVASKGVSGLFSEAYFTQEPNIHILEQDWNVFIKEQPFLKNTEIAETSERVYIKETDQGFELVDLCKGILDQEQACKTILSAIQDRKELVSLSEEGCYKDLPHTEDEKDTIFLYEQLQLFCNRIIMHLTIQGEIAFTIDGSVLKEWIQKDEDQAYVFGKDGTLSADYDKIKDYVNEITKQLTTYFGEPWQFTTHDGEMIEVQAGNFGRALKAAELSERIIKALDDGVSQDYELEFVFYPESAENIAYGAGYGTSYIEVDIEEQHMYLYLEGEQVMDSPVVTGDVHLHRDTPKGVFYVEYKQRNRTLVGPNYRTPVNYWIHFYNHCGFHDAYWRKSFGDEIYLKNGSHGCVNMPPEKAAKLYEYVYSGLPVIIY